VLSNTYMMQRDNSNDDENNNSDKNTNNDGNDKDEYENKNKNDDDIINKDRSIFVDEDENKESRVVPFGFSGRRLW